MGSKGKKLENDARARQKLAAGRETELYGTTVPGYTEFAKTGGVSPEEAEAVRRQTASANAGIFSRLKSALERRQRVQGGYAPGFGAQEAKLGRTAANVAGENLTGANLGILQQQRMGRLAGLGGLTNIQQGYEGEQQGLFGTRTELEKKRRGFLGNLSAGLDVGGQIAGAIGGF